MSSGIPVNEEKLSRLYGRRWRELRTLISPAFNSSKLKRAFPMMNECTDEFLEILDKTVGDRKGIDISIRFCRLSTEILLRFTMGTGLGFQAASEESERLLHGVRAAIRRPAFNWILYSNAIPLWLWFKKLFFKTQGWLIVSNTSIHHRHIAELVRLRKEKKQHGEAGGRVPFCAGFF
ncbi:putative cytochrome P450 CYP13A8 [Ixodes scapularis]